MWLRPEKPVAIHPSQIRIGIYVWLELSWDEHPFLYNKFRIDSDEQIEKIKALNLDTVFYFPNKSKAEPLAYDASKVTAQAAVTAPALTVPAATTPKAPNNEKARQRPQQMEAAARASRAWEDAARKTREALLGMSRNPRQAGEAIAELSGETARMISASSEILLHLLGDKSGDGPQFHALNVMTLSMILGKALALGETELADLAMGSIAHDCGKARVPVHILKSKMRQKHEEAFYRSHCAYGVEYAMESGAFSSAAITIIRDHHELLDRTGFPEGRHGSNPMAMIVSLVNRYDRLCCPESPEKKAMMPAEALAYIYAKESAKFDPKLIKLLIRILGVYPPGTIVQLSDGSLGLVVSPGEESLRPKVLIYDTDVAKEEAPVVDLATMPSLRIEESLPPDSLPPDVLQWLNPRQRLSYFFSVDADKG